MLIWHSIACHDFCIVIREKENVSDERNPDLVVRMIQNSTSEHGTV